MRLHYRRLSRGRREAAGCGLYFRRFLVLDIDSDDAKEVMGWPDDLKLRSSMTLFALAKPECEVFQKVLDKFFGGEMDQKTIKILRENK